MSAKVDSVHGIPRPDVDVAIPTDGVLLEGTLSVPQGAFGLVVFVHGSGSSRFSPRNRAVAQMLNAAGLATLLIDLLGAKEHARDSLTTEYRFNIPLLAGRVTKTLEWCAGRADIGALPVGLFGASTGAAAALVAAADRPENIKAVVSRGGRPDLAGAALEKVRAPTLLVVGAKDTPVIALNRQAAERLPAEHQLVIVPDATHLFEEPGTLKEVAFLAADWFERHLGSQPRLTGGAPLRLGRQPHERFSSDV